MKNYVIYAHRGASAYAPENTISAFDKAIELGTNGIELDLQKTKDNKIVVFHNKLINKKSNGIGRISDYKYEELKKLDFGSWFSDEFKNEKIVLFEDFAKRYLNKNIMFSIELKSSNIEKEVLEIIYEYSININNIHIASFSYDTLKDIRKLDKNIKLSYLVLKITDKNISDFIKINGYQIAPKASQTTESDIEKAKKYNLNIRLWDVDHGEIIKKIKRLDVDEITTNYPDKFIAILNN